MHRCMPHSKITNKHNNDNMSNTHITQLIHIHKLVVVIIAIALVVIVV